MKKQKSIVPSTQSTEANIESKELKIITEFILQNISAEKIICFGSTVTRTKNTSCFTQEEEKTGPQQLNSYYILIIPAITETLPDVILQQRIEQGLKAEVNVTVIVHRMEEINLALENGSSFFTTIYKKGTLLHDDEKELFVMPAPGAAIHKRIVKREKFWEQWFELSENFLLGAHFYALHQKNSLAIYMLHQTLQHCYSGMLRVLTGYRSNSANGLRRLLSLIENVLPESSLSSSKDTPEDARLTGLLLKGFGDARYNDKFKATDEEVSILANRIELILKSANIICQSRIKNIKEGKVSYIA